MIVLTGFAFFFSVVGLFVSYLLKKRNKNIFFQKIRYMNAVIDKEKISQFKLNQKFTVSIHSNDIIEPEILDVFMENYYYSTSVSDFRKDTEFYSKLIRTLLAITVVLFIIGIRL